MGSGCCLVLGGLFGRGLSVGEGSVGGGRDKRGGERDQAMRLTIVARTSGFFLFPASL